jgi:glycosyltransferase involved in cell wall biosynthesis
LKLLIITPVIPYPLDEGGALAQYSILEELRHQYSVSLFLVCNNNIEKENINILRKKWENVDFYVYDLTKSQFNLKYKISKLYRKFKNKPINFKNDFENPNSLKLVNIKSKEFINFLNDCITNINPDLIQIEFLSYIDLALIIPKKIVKIFVHHEIRFARLESSYKLISADNDYYKYLIRFIKLSELRYLSSYDCIISFSESDKNRLLIELDKKVSVFSSPFTLPKNYFKHSDSLDDKVTKLIFIGPEKHKPNKDALEWYINEMGGLIYLNTGLKLTIIGNWSNEFINKQKRYKFLNFVGFVSDLSSYFDNSIMLVPIRVGSGIRTKILHSMANKCPLISTSLGYEGIDLIDGEHILRAETSQQFLNHIITLISNTGLRNSLINNSFNFVIRNYSPEICVNKRMSIYQFMLQNNNA